MDTRETFLRSKSDQITPVDIHPCAEAFPKRAGFRFGQRNAVDEHRKGR
jgi:hypothetical protein